MVTIVTDLGHICSRAAKYIKAANFLVIESNYDKDMLFNGHYPAFLKSRIHSNRGHLANEVTASFLAENMNPDLTHICLAHLSKDNNTPELAMLTLKTILYENLSSKDTMPEIIVLERNLPSGIFIL
jgi:phosphoribosyl 1,2-cyclic phosphodiesterase